MPITSINRDIDALTMTVVANFAATRERLWDAYTDPRQIEKFWGPVEWPATFTRHDVFVGGRSTYFMIGPDGERSTGFWEFLTVDNGKFFEVRDGFADAEGQENPDMPSMRTTFSFEDTDAGSRLVTTTHFGSLEQLEQLLGMGMEEGMASAMGQIDHVLADLESFAAGRGTEQKFLSDTRVRVTRIIRGSIEQVWRAHHDAALLQQAVGPRRLDHARLPDDDRSRRCLPLRVGTRRGHAGRHSGTVRLRRRVAGVRPTTPCGHDRAHDRHGQSKQHE